MKVRKDDEHFCSFILGWSIFSISHLYAPTTHQARGQVNQIRQERKGQAEPISQGKKRREKINGKKLEEEERVRETQQQAHKIAFWSDQYT